MLPTIAQCRRAFAAAKSSNARGSATDFDGRVFRGDSQRGRFCRPICTVTAPTAGDSHFFASAAAAHAHGLVACAECQPEYAPRCPDWALGQRPLIAAVRALEHGLDGDDQINAAATVAGLSPTDLQDCFVGQLGVTPAQYQRWQRLAFAKRLLDGTDWSLTTIATAANMGSASRLSRALRAGFGAPPRLLRKRSVALYGQTRAIRLPLRAPYDANWVMEFLTKRSLPGLEEVCDDVYQRRLPSSVGATPVVGDWLQVRIEQGELRVELPAHAVNDAAGLIGRVQHVFDAHADPRAIGRVLKTDAGLAKSAATAPGLRVPGAWDGFETTVRAILGQQVSVARARNLAIDLIARFGTAGNFPTPSQLVAADVSVVGMPGKRGGAVRALASAVLDGQIALHNRADPEALFEGLCALPGIGPWTAGYVSMRVVGDADAFPRADWVVLKRLAMTAAVAQRHSLRWQPYRAYALMHIWRGDS